MLQVQGNARLTNLRKVSDKLIVGDVYTIKQVGNDFKTSFFKCKIVGNGIKTVIKEKIGNKTTVNIENAIIEMEDYKTKEGKKGSNATVVIFELNKYTPNGFNQVNDEELPF